MQTTLWLEMKCVSTQAGHGQKVRLLQVTPESHHSASSLQTEERMSVSAYPIPRWQVKW